MAKQLIKGNEAIVKAAVLGGCRAFYGYPITPASEIAEAAALYVPQAGGVFIQAESEVSAINMIYGAAAAGVRSMTASSGPGFSLMQEGFSYLAGAELPCVVADIVRGGPGLGNIAPEQSDYHQVVKCGGHGCYRTFVLAPDSVQEMCDLTLAAFDLADRYRNPAVVVADGYIGQMMEPVSFPERAVLPETPGYAVTGTAETRANLISSIYLEPDVLEAHVRQLEAKYRRAEDEEVRCECRHTEDADIVLIGYGIVARVLKSVVEAGRALGMHLGLLRPITLYPFPTVQIREVAEHAAALAVVELSTGQLVEDVRLAVEGRRPVEFYGRVGGNVPSAEEVLAFVRGLVLRHTPGARLAGDKIACPTATEVVDA
jgi:2-oxoisovalerate ferredoxin oxidoreductase alpha subunit